ncbi:hypothetical protein BJ508DRAFT_327601 [Ascobolus immersus RN42]|uniref:Uncharacterized protein n=1 Tax=Ascobolus immersus RN42 TaxID=1160509 RepID=A0A3N4I605_ASCIM|nr:hypothetical protein BJ508DRAFT_327601 [Ascobolus immersus RN42]
MVILNLLVPEPFREILTIVLAHKGSGSAKAKNPANAASARSGVAKRAPSAAPLNPSTGKFGTTRGTGGTGTGNSNKRSFQIDLTSERTTQAEQSAGASDNIAARGSRDNGIDGTTAADGRDDHAQEQDPKLYRGGFNHGTSVIGPIAGAKNLGKAKYRPVCFYREEDHSGTYFCLYSSNDNDLSCIERKPELNPGAENAVEVDIMMFESFIGGWGPVACFVGTNELFAYIADKHDTIRGLLSGCHRLKGTLAWDLVEYLGTGTAACGRVMVQSIWCPGSLLPGETNSSATQRYQDNSIISPDQQVVGGRRS